MSELSQLPSTLFDKNSLRQDALGIWRQNSETPFDYADADRTEENLKEILKNSKDKSVLSGELEAKIFNWASEYHLSSQRANLFRFLKLDRVQRMLELGSGCGANTRYLGELGIQVDAVEGSYARAEISKIRCEDIANVNIVHSNFNRLTYPDACYDSVSFMGVLEYAGKYHDDSKTGADAVIDILQRIKAALKEDGLLFIAIENRLGLKYWLGASEDHLDRPYAGIYDYPGNDGIRTFTRPEWTNILESAGYPFYRFCYPFPDYKLPRVIISDHFLRNDPYAYSLLYRIASRDYGKVWHPEADEFLIWRALHRSGDIENFSNSFFIVASASRNLMDRAVIHDFMQFPDSVRKLRYSTITFKTEGESHVCKEKIADTEGYDDAERFLAQTIAKRSNYIAGRLLSSVWRLSIEAEPNAHVFESLIREYYVYLQQRFPSSATHCEILDLLPSNIIVDDSGRFRAFDQEWVLNENVGPEFVFFRALFWFGAHNRYALSKLSEELRISSVYDFIAYTLAAIGVDIDRVNDFIRIEEKIHAEITRDFDPGSIENMLSWPLQYDENKILFHNEELVAEKNKEIQHRDNEIHKRNREINRRDRKIQQLAFELDAIENSKVWRLAVYLRILFYERFLGHFPLVQKGAFYLSNEGFRPFSRKTAGYILRKLRLSSSIHKSRYDSWIEKNEITPDDYQKITDDIDAMTLKPLISVIMPVYNVDVRWLEKAIQSVENQLYGHWELCIADDSSPNEDVRNVLRRYEGKDSRISVQYLTTNQGISAASNHALSMAGGDYIALLDHDDELSKDALYEVARLINQHPDACMIYSDEDMIDENGFRMNPYFKPDWSPDTLLSGNYITHLSVYQKAIVDDIGGFREGYEGSQDFDLALRFSEQTNSIHHIPKILYHWRKIEGSVAASTTAKNYAYDNAKKALEDTLRRRNISGEIEFGYGTGYYVLKRSIDASQLVSVIVPCQGSGKSIQRCLESIDQKTHMQNYEILVTGRSEDLKRIDGANGNHRWRMITSEQAMTPFEAYNFAAEHARGRYLIFLSDNVEVVSEFWMRSMLEHSQRPDIGAVGAKLLYPDNRVRHAGIILGINGVAGYAYHKNRDFTEHYFGHLNIIKNYSAVSSSCMMIKTDLFRQAGGFDSINLPYHYGDVDLCLKLRDLGLRNVYTPFSVLFCHRIPDTKTDVAEEDDRYYMLEKWGDRLEQDPYYNPNLTLSSEDFAVRV